MSADSLDNFEYQPASMHVSDNARKHYWAVAIGLQEVDGLEVSAYLRELADGYTKGDYTLAQTGSLIRKYHGVDGEHSSVSSNEPTREADLVSQRIAELLAASPFYLAPEILSQIHAFLFQDLDSKVYQPGAFKQERMVKQEEILNGDSVLYADPLAFEGSLQMVFNAGHVLDRKDLACSRLFENPELLRNVSPSKALNC